MPTERRPERCAGARADLATIGEGRADQAASWLGLSWRGPATDLRTGFRRTDRPIDPPPPYAPKLRSLSTESSSNISPVARLRQYTEPDLRFDLLPFASARLSQPLARAAKGNRFADAISRKPREPFCERSSLFEGTCLRETLYGTPGFQTRFVSGAEFYCVRH